MAYRYVRSVFWLCTCSGLGYGLLIIATPSAEDIKELRKNLPGAEQNPRAVLSKNQQFVNILESATENKKPFYRLSKDQIDKELKKD